MDESTSPAQCSAIAQLQVSIKRVLSPSDVYASQKVGSGYAQYAGMRVAVLAASVKMRIVNDAGPSIACSDADQDEVKATLLTPVMMTMQIDSYTVAGDGVPD